MDECPVAITNKKPRLLIKPEQSRRGIKSPTDKQRHVHIFHYFYFSQYLVCPLSNIISFYGLVHGFISGSRNRKMLNEIRFRRQHSRPMPRFLCKPKKNLQSNGVWGNVGIMVENYRLLALLLLKCFWNTPQQS